MGIKGASASAGALILFMTGLRNQGESSCSASRLNCVPLVRDGAVSSPRKDLLLLPASLRCTLCTTRRQRLDGGTCRADGREL